MKTESDSIRLAANRAARAYGTNKATQIVVNNSLCMPAKVVYYDGYHCVSKTGIRGRCGLAALKRWPKTYKYVSVVCRVEVNPGLIALIECGELALTKQAMSP